MSYPGARFAPDLDALEAIEHTLATPPGVHVASFVDEDTSKVHHRWLDRFAGYVHQMVVGADAARVLAELEGRDGGSVVVLPTWVWIRPRVNVGESKNGNLLPARVSWDCGHVVVGAEVTVATYTVCGLGFEHTGTVKVRSSDSSFSPETDLAVEHDGVQTIVGQRISGARLRHALEELASAGKTARWLALECVRPHAVKALDYTRFALARDVNPDAVNPPPVFDEIKRDQLATAMLFGRDGDTTGKTSPAWRMLDRCMLPGTFTRTDPMRYVRITIQRDATDAARSHLGDPRIGSRIREVARELKTRDIGVIVEHYRDLFPKDHLSHARAIRAMQFGNDVSVLTAENSAFSDDGGSALDNEGGIHQ